MGANRMTRVAIITGAGSGIGAATARRIAAPGSALMLHSQGADQAARDRLEAVGAACRLSGAAVETRTGDLAASGEATALVAGARAHFGPIDTLVHAAGFADRRSLAVLTRADLDRAFAAMPGAFFDLAAAALPDLSRAPTGRVVAVSSFVAHKFAAAATFPASAAAKAALEALVRSVAIELAPSGATANAVVPGYTRKDAGKSGTLTAGMWAAVATANPQGRLAEPEDVAGVIAFLLSREAGHITGALLPVDGGLTLG